jgi:hypothetical protein
VLNRNFHSNVNVSGRFYKHFLTSLYRSTLFDIFFKPDSKQKLLGDYYTTFSISALVSAREQSWRADMGRGLIPGMIWKILCHNLFITYFTLTFFQALTLILQKRHLHSGLKDYKSKYKERWCI